MKKTKKVTKIQVKSSKFNSVSRMASELQEQLHQSKKIPKNYIKNIEIEFDQFQQLIQSVSIESCITPGTRGLNIKRLANLLEKRYHIFSKDKLIKFYLQEGSVYLTVPSAKKSFSIFEIDEDDFLQHNIIKLQMFKQKQMIDVVMEDSDEESDLEAEDEDDADADDKEMAGKCRRLKERKIKHVIEKVLKWRQLYARKLLVEFLAENGDQSQKVSLEEGAKLVKISKKTLDDYLSQLKKGKKYGFNFNDHRNEKIGVLREFIRKIEKKR